MATITWLLLLLQIEIWATTHWVTRYFHTSYVIKIKMDQDQMEQAGPVQCRNGCGFYSNAGTDGLCSVCYKDCIKKKQQPPTNMPASLVPTSMAPSGNGSSSSPPQMTSLSIGDEMANAITSSVPSSSPTLTNSNKSGPISVETGSPTVILPSSSSTLQTEKVSIRILFSK